MKRKINRLVRKADTSEKIKQIVGYLIEMDDDEFICSVEAMAGANSQFADNIGYFEVLNHDNFNFACEQNEMDYFDVLQGCSNIDINKPNVDRFTIKAGYVLIISNEEYAKKLRTGTILKTIANECLNTMVSLPINLKDFIDNL